MDQAARAFNSALNMLARRSRSVGELRQKLADKGFSREEVTATIDRLLALGFLDDGRLAGQLAESLMRNRRMVGGRLRLELKKRRIPDPLIEAVCEQAAAECDRLSLLREIMASRYPDFDFNAATDREKRRVVGFLQRRGFHLSEILDNLRQRDCL